MAVVLGRPQSVRSSRGGATKRSTCEAWFALNRHAYQTVLNMAIQAEMNMTSAEVTVTLRHRQEQEAEWTPLLDHCAPTVGYQSCDVMNSSSNEVPANGPRDHFVTSPSDDVITVAKYSQEERKLPEVFVTTIEDTCHTAEEQSSGGAQSALESLTENAAVTEHDAEGVVNVAWTAVDKRRLVELINQLSTGGDAKAQSNPAADIHEHRSRRETSPGHLMHIHCHSASERSCHENSLIQSERDHHSPLVPQQDTSLESVSCTYLDLGKYEEANISSCPKVPKQSDHTDASRMPPCRKTNKQVSGLSGNPEKPPQKVAQASFEVWTSVDKTLVEDLFDKMLRSFDEIKVRRPEADETGCGGSRGWSSVSRLSSTDDVTYGLVDGRQWHSAAYKWKSQILQRMRSQPVTKHAPLRRKRPYAELKLVPNSAF